MDATVTTTRAETNDPILTSEAYLADEIRLIDQKTSEIEASVEQLSQEEAGILAQRASRVPGDVDAIIARTRQDQMRLQKLRDTIEIEQAPLAELKSRRAEVARQYETLKRLKTKERIKQILAMIDAMQQELVVIKETLETLNDTTL